MATGSLGDVGERLAHLMDPKVFDVHVGPQFGLPLREVPRRLKDQLGSDESLLDDVDRWHHPILIGYRNARRAARGSLAALRTASHAETPLTKIRASGSDPACLALRG